MNSGSVPTTLTREVLYERVWKTPITRLAKDLGVTYTDLAKLCERHGVPRPSAGYWSQMANGKTVEKGPLPSCSNESLATITLGKVIFTKCETPRRELKTLASTFFDPEIGALAERESTEHERIVPSSTLRAPHPLVKRTLQGFAIAAKDRVFGKEPVLWSHPVDDKNCLDVEVSKEQINRATCIMDALIKGLEDRGYAIRVSDERHQHGTFVTGFGDTYQLRLREPRLRRDHVPTQEEQEYLDEYPGRSLLSQYDYVASGRLQLELMTAKWRTIIKTFREGPKRKMEELVAEVPMAILRRIDHYRERAAINAEEARQQAEAQRLMQQEEELRKREDQRRKDEQTKIEALFLEAEQWARCRTLRDYLDAARNAALERLGFIEKGSDLDQWLAWGERIAELQNPIGNSEVSPLPSPSHELTTAPKLPR